MAINYLDSFKKKLEEIFMMDHAELDFGIYRIMNQKRQEIQSFLDTKLLPQVTAALASSEDSAARKRMAEIEAQVGGNVDVLPIGTPMRNEYDRLKASLATSGNAEEMQRLVFSHLVTFFSRYYDGGDFLSKRRYKADSYAIPYNGEEVKLHWANADQYYIKTSEYFRDYTFVLPTSRRKVHFVLKDATTEQNNNRSQNNMERRFALLKPEGDEPILEITEQGELNIFFTYELMPKSTKQKDLNTAALQGIMPLVPSDFSELLAVKAPTAANANRTLLEKHITDYTAKNSFDYFIHKDLGGFLSRELDFYIKNEVLFLDDLDPKHIASQLAVVKAIKGVGEKIITMLAQLEDFQRRLWLKKKFVVGCDYCITLNRIDEKFYPEIAANDAQREEWIRLFAINEIKGNGMFTRGYSEPLTIDFLKENPFLVLDTAFFSAEFKHRLLATFDHLDEQTNGLLINSENFQALQLLQEKYSKRVKCIYIDPPYNAKSSEILYKNTFKDSSWISLMENRLSLAKRLKSNDNVEVIAIDEVEQTKLGELIRIINEDATVACVSVVHNPRGQMGKNISYSHEFAYFIYPNDTEKFISNFKRESIDSRTLRDSGTESDRTDAAKCFYPFIIENGEIIEIGQVPDDNFHPVSANVIRPDGLIEIWPIDDNGNEKKWRYAVDTVSSILPKLEVKQGRTSLGIIFNQDMGVMRSCWTGAKYDASEYGTKMLQKLFGIPYCERYAKNLYPKSINTEMDCIQAGFSEQNQGIVLDFFAGSGTTSNATINLNRDGGNRKYILVEMGSHYHTVTKPRTQKASYSADWRDGKPVGRDGVSQCFKYIRLEQYEDTLNNLQLKQQGTLPDDDFGESYMLQYMLDVETRESLLNMQWFVNPFSMTLKTTRDNELVETPVDMVETFNYLIGLDVDTIDWYNNGNICAVTGTTHRDGLKTLVIWRNCEQIDNEALNRFFERMDYRTRDTEFDQIYVNGDNTLPNLRRDEESWKVVLIEEEFLNRMFED